MARSLTAGLLFETPAHAGCSTWSCCKQPASERLRAVKRLAKALAGVLLAVALAGILGTLVPRPLWPASVDGGTASRHILVLKNPIHTDIAIPVDAKVRDRFSFLAGNGVPIDNPAVRFIIFGWGGRAFYIETPTWSDIKLIPVLKALTLDRSVMHVDVAVDIPEPHPDIMGIDLSNDRFSALLDSIDATFARDAAGPLPIVGVAYTDHDGFYEANGSFNALVGCNVWTAATLRRAGLRTGLWNPLPWSLFLSLDLYNRAQLGGFHP